jgi:hypothetical protein
LYKATGDEVHLADAEGKYVEFGLQDKFPGIGLNDKELYTQVSAMGSALILTVLDVWCVFN